MPRDTTQRGCSMCEFGRRQCVSPVACQNPHVFGVKDEPMVTLAWKALVFVLAVTALGFFIARGVA